MYLCRSSHDTLMRIGLRSIDQEGADENGTIVWNTSFGSRKNIQEEDINMDLREPEDEK